MRQHNDPDVLSQSLAEPSRRALLENLRFGQKTVTQLVEATGLKQPNVSNHLAKMRLQGIVRAERIGRQVFYSLSMPFADVLLRMHEVAATPYATRSAILHGATEASKLSSDGDGTHSPHGDASDHALYALKPPKAQHNAVPDAEYLAERRAAYFQAVMMGNEELAVTLVNGLLAHRLPMETIYLEVFAKCINHIGELYQNGETDVTHEHMASEITERMMGRVAQFHTPVARLKYRAILGCVAGNWHTLGLRMLTDGLKEIGWGTVFLGANVPTASFIALTEAMQPDLVVVSCAMQEQIAAMNDLLTRLAVLRKADTGNAFLISVGGYHFHQTEEDLTRLAMDFTSADLHEFLEMVKERFPDEE